MLQKSVDSNQVCYGGRSATLYHLGKFLFGIMPVEPEPLHWAVGTATVFASYSLKTVIVSMAILKGTNSAFTLGNHIQPLSPKPPWYRRHLPNYLLTSHYWDV